MNLNSTCNYLIICPSRSPTPWLISRRLHTRIIGKRIYFYKTMRSTQKLALSLAEKKPTDVDGTVIIAEQQTDATGRSGRRWISPAGGIWMSVILKPNVLISRSIVLMFLATLTVCDVIKSKTGLNPKIKWPNDVTINERKVSGILVDISVLDESICYAVIGIGINVNNETKGIVSEIVTSNSSGFYGITSLKKELNGLDISQVDLIGSLLAKLEYYYDQLQQGFHDEIVQKWKGTSEILDKPIVIKEQDKVFQAIAEDIDLSGAIVVKTSDGNTRKIFSPEIISIMRKANS
ncbi:MAG: biotin--[acetyl-CoA-carboxylase] ligase [Nitrososphaeraceae archaeon]